MQSQEYLCECGTPGIFCIEEKVIKAFPRYPTVIGEKTCNKCGKTITLTQQLTVK